MIVKTSIIKEPVTEIQTKQEAELMTLIPANFRASVTYLEQNVFDSSVGVKTKGIQAVIIPSASNWILEKAAL